jgi:hypothetical protein
MNDIIDKVRSTLKQWDDGLLSRGEFEAELAKLFFDPEMLETLEAGTEIVASGSCCCSSHPPDRTFKVEITITPHGYIARRCD